MTRLSISLGTGALPAVAEALEHARANPTHDPVLFAEVRTELMRPTEQRVWWRCNGERDRTSLDPVDICARGGDLG